MSISVNTEVVIVVAKKYADFSVIKFTYNNLNRYINLIQTC